MDPCGTPIVIGLASDMISFTVVIWFLFLKSSRVCPLIFDK